MTREEAVDALVAERFGAKPVRVHVYVPDPDLPPDHRGVRPCHCGLMKGNAVHTLPPTPPEVVEVEARMVGEQE